MPLHPNGVRSPNDSSHRKNPSLHSLGAGDSSGSLPVELCVAPPRIDIVDSSNDTSGASITEAVQTFEPDVVLIGGTVLKPDVVATLVKIRESLPEVALIVLSASHDIEGIRALREFSRGNSIGCAYLLKHTIDSADQIAQTIEFVADRRLVVDPVGTD